MNVGLVADKMSIEAQGGIARYGQELLVELKKMGINAGPINANIPNILFGKAINHVFHLPYRVIKESKNFDLLHAMEPIMALSFPIIKKPKVITYHDLIPMLYRYADSPIYVRILAPLIFRINKYCDKVIADSELTKDDNQG